MNDDTITRDDPRFAETINSLKPGDEVEVEWSFHGKTATTRGVLWPGENCHLNLAHTFVRNKQGSSATTVTSIRIIKRAEPEWAKAKVIAVGLYGLLYYRRADGSYSPTLHGQDACRNAKEVAATWKDLVSVVVDAEGKWVSGEAEVKAEHADPDPRVTVKPFRHPYIKGTDVDPVCGRTWHEHGWIDHGDHGETVCPWDWDEPELPDWEKALLAEGRDQK